MTNVKGRIEFPEDEGPDGKWASRREVARYADEAMFQAVPITEEGEEVKPRVTVIDMTSNPLRKMTAVSALYNGRVGPSTLRRDNPEEALQWVALAGVRDGGRSFPAPLRRWIQD